MEIRANLQPTWSTIRQLRDEIGEQLSAESAAVRAAAQMVASELLENAIKYGEAVPDAREINFHFKAMDGLMTIIVSNGSTVEASFRKLRRHVDELASSADPSELYVARLQQLMDEPSTESAGLGIYRIGLEGGFALDCVYQNRVITVTATRSMT